MQPGTLLRAQARPDALLRDLDSAESGGKRKRKQRGISTGAPEDGVGGHDAGKPRLAHSHGKWRGASGSQLVLPKLLMRVQYPNLPVPKSWLWQHVDFFRAHCGKRA